MRRSELLHPAPGATSRARANLRTTTALLLLLAALLLGAVGPSSKARGDETRSSAVLADFGSDADFAPSEIPDAEEESVEDADGALAELSPEDAAVLSATEEAAAFGGRDDGATSQTASLAKLAAAASGKLAADDELWFVSARRARITADGPVGYDVWRYAGDGTWQTLGVADLATADPSVPTCFHVHGNRVSFHQAHCGGWAYYTAFTACGCRPRGPIRWVVFTWPSDRCCDTGPRKDVQIKAVRAECYGYYLAWLVDQLPAEARISMIGYSFGTRLIGSCLHVLGGGRIRGRMLHERRVHDHEIRAVLLAAALDDDHFLPGRAMQMAPGQLDRLLIARNLSDPALKWYPLLYELTLRRRRGQQSMGYTGLAGMHCLPDLTGRVETQELSGVVGREHDTHGCRYLAECFLEKMRSYVYYDPLPGDAE